MRAVNLIPPDDRAGRGGTAGRSGGAVYVVLGALTALVAMVAALAVASSSLSDKKTELVNVENQATASEAKAASLKNYADFRELRVKRADTVRSIAASRFDWSAVMHELARTIPGDIWLTGAVGTVDPNVQLKKRAVTAQVRRARGTPALELLGCAERQSSVAKMMTALRQIDGVRKVTLQQSLKLENATGQEGQQTQLNATDCRHGDLRFPQFTLVVFFDARPAPAPAAMPSTTTPPTTPSK